MAAPDWLLPKLGWKPATAKSTPRCIRLFGEAIAPNLSDVGNIESLSLAGHVYKALGITARTSVALGDSDDDTLESSGTALEVGIEEDVRKALGGLAPDRQWIVRRSGKVSDYSQFQHLKDLQHLFETDETLRSTIGRDYQVSTDIYVGAVSDHFPASAPFLHAAISSKWTIRSDRVQNVRHEFNTLERNRRGRLPHLVLITAEPLPSRLISIARGTGEVDAVYHLLFDELAAAVESSSNTGQQDQWSEMVKQRRLLPYEQLAENLTTS